MEEPQMHTAKWKKPILKGHILYDSNYIYNIQENNRQNCEYSKKKKN